MKGADHLLGVARHLRRRGVNFRMSICGAGDLEKSMTRSIERDGLKGHVVMKGVLDFETELVPFVKHETDLFVCCHRQGDPSCTYLETMSCGVPIVGYDNEAFRGIVELSRSGWLVPMNRPNLVAAEIARLSRNQEEIMDHASLARVCSST